MRTKYKGPGHYSSLVFALIFNIIFVLSHSTLLDTQTLSDSVHSHHRLLNEMASSNEKKSCCLLFDV
jgi:hypothetical protein